MNSYNDFIQPRAEFCALTVDAVDAALGDAACPNEISLEVGRLMQGYLSQLRGAAREDGEAVSSFIAFRPRFAIEAAAQQLTIGLLCDAIVDDGGSAMRDFWSYKEESALFRTPPAFEKWKAARIHPMTVSVPKQSTPPKASNMNKLSVVAMASTAA